MAHRMFRRAAAEQRCCQMCGKTGNGWDPHHVVYEQHLKQSGEPPYDTRNAMRLCAKCHAAHHGRSVVIPLQKLLLTHIDYAFAKLGPGAYDYLKQRYAGEDPRIEERLSV